MKIIILAFIISISLHFFLFKKYNKDELNKGGYFDWKTIENGQSSFVDKYFDKKRDNIVGDNS